MNRNRRHTRSRAIGDLILPFESGTVPASLADIRPQETEQPSAMTLIYSDTAEFAKIIKTGLSRFGRTSTVVNTPLHTIFQLQDETTTIDAMIVSLHDSRLDITVFFEFLKEEYPNVERIGSAYHRPLRQDLVSAHTCQHDMVLWDPWFRTDFIEILKDALDCRLSRTHSSWTELQLFESSQGKDSHAIAEIFKRYRYRIVRLLMDQKRGLMDTQDIVQEVYLTILQDLPLFDQAYSPGHWIDHIVGKRIRSFSIVEPSNIVSQSKVPRENRYTRAFRDGSWSIDGHSLFMGLESTRKVRIKERNEQPMQ